MLLPMSPAVVRAWRILRWQGVRALRGLIRRRRRGLRRAGRAPGVRVPLLNTGVRSTWAPGAQVLLPHQTLLSFAISLDPCLKAFLFSNDPRLLRLALLFFTLSAGLLCSLLCQSLLLLSFLSGGLGLGLELLLAFLLPLRDLALQLHHGQLGRLLGFSPSSLHPGQLRLGNVTEVLDLAVGDLGGAHCLLPQVRLGLARLTGRVQRDGDVSKSLPHNLGLDHGSHRRLRGIGLLGGGHRENLAPNLQVRSSVCRDVRLCCSLPRCVNALQLVLDLLQSRFGMGNQRIGLLSNSGSFLVLRDGSSSLGLRNGNQIELVE
mmetsp:Transcript_720/g.1567  ORF Transcript_720/g.1567 Transcript_720/m.1567 type:complete len:319 (+) Transcript_720:141-1097(+)